MSAPLTLSAEFRKIVETRMAQILRGVEETFNEIIEKQNITPVHLTAELESLQDNFNFVFQKWSLEILYTIMLRKTIGFGEIKKILGVNSRTLSDKLKMLQTRGYIFRNVNEGPPLRVEYSLSTKGQDTVLLALPLLYYSSSTDDKV
ncbi:MAG: helix-turn-helix transcriptional regulator [Crenarchaeota archaeon]|jgi:DNA-binding HxlR family transcriptional regulator|nr:helix-turn-helix transcriptional regulator [Thermoproteota archaeon]